MFAARSRAGLCAAALLLFCGAACNDGLSAFPNIVVPGFGIPGANRPPLFASWSLSRIGPRSLQLIASALDLDGDGLTITYQQLAGPTAVERSSIRIAGNLDIIFDIPADGTYIFRVIASDGFFNSDVRVTRIVTTQEPPLDDGTPVGEFLPQNPAVGRYRVTLVGQTTDTVGDLRFALDATLDIAAAPQTYTGDNLLVLQLDTDQIPTSHSASAGAVRLTSSATRAGLPDDAFAIVQSAKRLDLAGVIQTNGAAGSFRPGAISNGVVPIGRIDGFLLADGGVVSGTLTLVDPTGLAIWQAQLSGARVP